MEEYMTDLDPHWSSVDASQFIGVTLPYSTAGHPSAAVLTPISLPDSSFVDTGPSPVLNRQSQEYSYQSITDPSTQYHGLGITAPFPGDFPVQAPASYGFTHGGHIIDYNPTTTTHAITSPRDQRTRSDVKTAGPRSRTPVSILPHPEGLRRMEQERLHGHVSESHPQKLRRPRPITRGRRDPNAEEEDDFVEQLRGENVAWRVVAERFRERFHKDTSEARLQMRLQRRRKGRAAMWDEDDIRLLKRAYEYWRDEKYTIIAHKLQELGAKRVYTEQECEAQMQIELGELPGPSEVHAPPPPQPPRPDAQRRRKRASLKLSRRREEGEDD
ncbi:hypothetical protein Plec18167_003416 [Paecilomyces lecythidis]|uniref:Myb-like domain-containing protein n=1 Tax=Paecilomyces lecythidis TaxID=3004212 RepID=A0ABR3XXY7_9EURO